MTRDEAKVWLNRFNDLEIEDQRPCKYKHPQCSISDGGECLTEVINVACMVIEKDPT